MYEIQPALFSQLGNTETRPETTTSLRGCRERRACGGYLHRLPRQSNSGLSFTVGERAGVLAFRHSQKHGEQCATARGSRIAGRCAVTGLSTCGRDPAREHGIFPADLSSRCRDMKSPAGTTVFHDAIMNVGWCRTLITSSKQFPPMTMNRRCGADER